MEMRESRIADHVSRGVTTMNATETNAALCRGGMSPLILLSPATDRAEPFL
jgi:hypothetical protein